jgi:antirestriction protein ArdC
MTAKTAERDAKLAAAHDKLVEATEALRSSEGWAAMLAFAGKFHRYSLNNQMLIAMQRPEATRVAGFNRWKELGRTVRKGEKGIAILAPMTYKRTDEAGEDTYGIRGFRLAYVFDVEQTDGEPIPDIRPETLEGEAPEGLWDALAAQVAAAGYTLTTGDTGAANGYTEPATRTVVISGRLGPLAAVKTLAHELAHIELGHTLDEYRTCRDRNETEAESTAAILLGAHGVDTDAYSTAYITHWAKDGKQVREAAEAVLKAARAILDRIDA